MHFLIVQFESFTSIFSGANNFDQFKFGGKNYMLDRGEKFDHEIPLGGGGGGTWGGKLKMRASWGKKRTESARFCIEATY